LVVFSIRKFVVRKAVVIGDEQWDVMTVDEFCNDLLNKRDGYVLGITLPRLPSREVLEGENKWKNEV
jgi:hypothetical protein